MQSLIATVCFFQRDYCCNPSEQFHLNNYGSQPTQSRTKRGSERPIDELWNLNKRGCGHQRPVAQVDDVIRHEVGDAEGHGLGGGNTGSQVEGAYGAGRWQQPALSVIVLMKRKLNFTSLQPNIKRYKR